jgi:magnesium transporter
MTSKKFKKKSKVGLAPGSLVFTGEQKMDKPAYTIINFSEDTYLEFYPKNSLEVIDELKKLNGTIWLNIDGLHDENSIETIGSFLNIHKLTMEDLMSVGQRPKMEEYDDYIHTVIKMFMFDANNKTLEFEQISFILKNNVIITFQEKTGDVFNSIRKRIKEGKGTIRKRTADYLLYALLDAIVDQYFVILENFGEHMEQIESELLNNQNHTIISKLHLLRSETFNLRRAVYPLREIISNFEKLEDPHVKPDTKIFIRDLYDHTIQVIETIELFREMASSLLDLYMNSVSNKMNEIMKVLTIMASIFIPLTFLAGVYGMNFDNIPELHFKYGYFIFWGVMVAIFVLMIYFFRRKKWL